MGQNYSVNNTPMILPDLILPSRVNQHWYDNGFDSFDACMDKNYFKTFPYPVEYIFNSRGFRDVEWPMPLTKLHDTIWCVGDSFTVGLGSPTTHVWPYILQQKINKKTVNISMDGASNDWIARRTCDILTEINPKKIIIHWSYTHRREDTVENALRKSWNDFYNKIKKSDWPDCKDFDNLPEKIQFQVESEHNWNYYKTCIDEHRRIMINKENQNLYAHVTHTEDNMNLLNNIQKVETISTNTTQIIHSFIPNFSYNSYSRNRNTPITREDANFKTLINDKLHSISNRIIPEFTQLDWARDKFHYDIITANYFVDCIVNLINL